jgi:hypothetical protein
MGHRRGAGRRSRRTRVPPIEGLKSALAVSARDYLRLGVLLAIPVAAILVLGLNDGLCPACTPPYMLIGAVIYVMFIVFPFVAGPIMLRRRRQALARICAPEREIAAWRYDGATISSFEDKLKRQYPWTWRFRGGVGRRLGVDGHVEVRIYPEGARINKSFVPWSDKDPYLKGIRPMLQDVSILSNVDAVEVEYAYINARHIHTYTKRILIPFPTEAREQAAKVVETLGFVDEDEFSLG